ncbi:hypothetical protein M406DRAFT_334729 [Cryphonectria parasitica EP155]|uniref:Uncharacterized protein n=1 Tax=Cryphonectria parasitica (strain ATCC 38755 / EP155) TaxID=660469 RepID=A0A9P4XTT9_CRYP1|nr:uncharacterized protein M406DRAFT_334729 [Cryphonectria parasitica EP155]KAF3761122.1 hypothetical protein M406DRAFT_334729 [Cryphonectria parasitica EP155]
MRLKPTSSTLQSHAPWEGCPDSANAGVQLVLSYSATLNVVQAQDTASTYGLTGDVGKALDFPLETRSLPPGNGASVSASDDRDYQRRAHTTQQPYSWYYGTEAVRLIRVRKYLVLVGVVVWYSMQYAGPPRPGGDFGIEICGLAVRMDRFAGPTSQAATLSSVVCLGRRPLENNVTLSSLGKCLCGWGLSSGGPTSRRIEIPYRDHEDK